MVWGFLKSIFGSRTARTLPTEAFSDAIHLTQGEYFDVVGESFYQDHLEVICGGRKYDAAKHHCRAFLVPEPENPVDQNAIRIVIDGRTVGHLSREHAVEYHQHIGPRPSTCAAKIVGGWDDGETVGYFGVKLRMKWPPKERKSAAQK